MSNKFIKTFESHSTVNETVKQIGDVYKVGSIEVPQSIINSYVRKVKDKTGKNLRNLFSDMEIAEELIGFLVDKYLFPSHDRSIYCFFLGVVV